MPYGPFMEPEYPCGPDTPYRGGIHRRFLHWITDNAGVAFNFGYAPYATWVVDAEGTAILRIVDADPGKEGGNYKGRGQYGYYADVSPDGSRIVYSTCEYTIFDHDKGRKSYNRGYEMASVHVDGSGRHRLTDNVHFENYPVWSPDGNRIAFVAHNDYSRRADYDFIGLSPDHYHVSNSEIFTRAADGTDERVVPNTKGVGLYPPVWSPDGQRLAFTAHDVPPPFYRPSEPLERILYTVRLDGSELSRIGKATILPTWSPDGERVAFALDDRIYTVRYDGANLSEVLDDFRANEVSWSPDGTELLLASDGGVYVVRPDGSDLRALGPPIRTTVATWSPDGSMIAARREYGEPVSLDRRVEIAVMARDGTDTRTLAEVGYVAAVRDWEARPSNPPPAIDPAACSAGVVVPAPGANPGLVEDCEALARTWSALTSQGMSVPDAISQWNRDTPIAEWPGVEIYAYPLRVRKLVLRESGLTGPIPPDLAALAMLVELDLSYNSLTGPIPPELGKLSLLKTLDLSHNTVRSPIPAELGKLTMLTALDLSYNDLVGPIPAEMGGLTMLKELYLLDNKLTGTIPPALGKMAVLEKLYLSYNELIGTIPQELSGMTALETVRLRENDLTGCVPIGLPDMWVEASGLPRCKP